jgi:4-hydroxy-tetrahydrodipicolinate synthase
MFSGVWPALPTPFAGDGIDFEALKLQMDRLREAGVAGFVACGTTGESPTLSRDEWAAVVAFCVNHSGGLPVMAGSGSNNTADTVEKTLKAAALGASAVLVVVPYYNKPTQAGLRAHFEHLADRSPVPIILYNIPGRTGVNMLPETIAALARHPKIQGIKEAAGSLDQVSQIVRLTADLDFAVLSGDDSLTLPLLAVGGHGVISTNANVVPAQMVALVKAFQDGRTAQARDLHLAILELTSLLFVETNPAPLKYALSLLGIGNPEVRLPLVPLSEKHREPLRAAMQGLRLIP